MNPMNATPVNARRIRIEILVVLAVSFGMSGVRSLLRLIDASLSPVALNQQEVSLTAPQARSAWLDLSLQLTSAGTLFAWGALVLFLLASQIHLPVTWRWTDLSWGAGLAAMIGIPGLVFYVTAVQLGLSKQVIPTTLDDPWWEIPILLIYSAANAFGEETVVVFWLMVRLRQLGWGLPAVIGASSILRGSYHLYQGFSAGLGNIIMGVVFCWFFHKTGRLWPLVLAHFLIDAVAFVGYTALGGNLSWLGL